MCSRASGGRYQRQRSRKQKAEAEARVLMTRGGSPGWWWLRFATWMGDGAGFLRSYAVQGAVGRGSDTWYLLAHGEMLAHDRNRVTLHPSRTDAWGVPLAHIACAPSENEVAMAADQIQTMRELAAAAGLEKCARRPPAARSTRSRSGSGAGASWSRPPGPSCPAARRARRSAAPPGRRSRALGTATLRALLGRRERLRDRRRPRPPVAGGTARCRSWPHRPACGGSRTTWARAPHPRRRCSRMMSSSWAASRAMS